MFYNNRNTLKKDEIPYMLIFYFPLVNIIFSIVSSGNFSLLFSVSYLMLIIISQFVFVQKGRLSIMQLSIIFLILVYSLYYISKYSSESIIQYSMFILYLIFFSNSTSRSRCLNFIFRQENTFFLMSIIYFILLGYTIFNGTGIQSDNWETTTLCGPYNLPHTLSYELLGLILVALILYDKYPNKKKLLIGVFVSSICILLTAVRSTLLMLVICLFIFWKKQRINKKFYLVVISMLALLYILLNTNLVNSLIEKTISAIEGGSITNGRGLIAVSSFKAFEQASIQGKLFGIGMENLMQNNMTKIGLNIQAHNDLLNILVCYGLINMILSIFIIIRFFKGRGMFEGIVVFLIPFLFNGVYLYPAFVIVLLQFRIFFFYFSKT